MEGGCVGVKELICLSNTKIKGGTGAHLFALSASSVAESDPPSRGRSRKDGRGLHRCEEVHMSIKYKNQKEKREHFSHTSLHTICE